MILTRFFWDGLLCFDLPKFLKELWPLTNIRILFLLNILRMNGWNLTKFIMCIDIDEILVGIIIGKIAQIYDRVTALDLSQNFAFAQYLKNVRMELNKILHTL